MTDKAKPVFYRIYASVSSIRLIPLPGTQEIKQDPSGRYYYEFHETDVNGEEIIVTETVYPSRHLAWEEVKADLRNQIQQHEKLLKEVVLSWSKDLDHAVVPSNG